MVFRETNVATADPFQRACATRRSIFLLAIALHGLEEQRKKKKQQKGSCAFSRQNGRGGAKHEERFRTTTITNTNKEGDEKQNSAHYAKYDALVIKLQSGLRRNMARNEVYYST